MSGHSNIGPSSAERWIACPGSVALSEKCPKPKTQEYAAEGTVAHTLAEELASGKTDEMGLMGKVGTVVKCDGYDIEISDEMVEGAIEYRDVIEADHAVLVAAGKPAEVHRRFEIEVHLKSIAPDLWGTSDALLYRKGHKLIVYDYKFGKGHAVEIVENKQLGLYALGAMETIAGEAYDEVELVIVQPRARHAGGRVRRWTATRQWLKQFRADAHAAVLETAKPGAKLVAGDHCYFCPARAACPEVYKAVQRETQSDFAAMPPTESEVKAGQLRGLPALETMTKDKLALALSWRDAIEAWLGSVEAYVQMLLESGVDVPGWKLVEGRSVRKYKDETGEAAAARYAGQYGSKVYEPQKVLSPAKMEKLVGKGKIDDLVEKPAGRLKVAKASDPRGPAPTSAQQDFDPLGLPAPAEKALFQDIRLENTGVDPLLAELHGVAPKRAPLWPV